MSSAPEGYWNSILGLVEEIKRCDTGGMVTASVAMSYICIDALANLSRPADKSGVTRSDFIAWVDRHMTGHPDQPYQYRGKDVYAARCAMLHTYGSKAEMHSREPDTIIFGYHDGGKHAYEPKIDARLVIIGSRSLTNDVVCAVESFFRTCHEDSALKARVEQRLPEVLRTFPVSSQS